MSVLRGQENGTIIISIFSLRFSNELPYFYALYTHSENASIFISTAFAVTKRAAG